MTNVSTSDATKRRAAPLPADERRSGIIEAVLPLLIEQGEAVTTRQIAEAAGVSEGTIFNVFEDKDELIGAVIDVAIDPAPFEQSIAAIDPNLTFERRLVRVTELIQQRTVDIWQLVSKVGKPSGGHRPMPSSPALVAMLRADADRLRMPADEAASGLRALALAMTHPMLSPSPPSADHIVDVFLNGVRA